MAHKAHDLGISKNIAKYSDAIEVAPGVRWLFTAGTPGMSEAGELPTGIEAQSRAAWANILTALTKANMELQDLVKVNTTLTNTADIATYAKVRAEIVGDARPAFMMQVVNQMIRPDILVEIEVIAARADDR
ncbi:MAG TPA: Rid family hydrolase [Gemmatimonadaceae bacterium]|jgi:2-iminobutanoate/2-iminopropanoate deaminase